MLFYFTVQYNVSFCCLKEDFIDVYRLTLWLACHQESQDMSVSVSGQECQGHTLSIFIPSRRKNIV